MKVMNELSSVNPRKYASTAGNRELFGHLSCPNRPGCKERKNHMIREHKLSSPPDGAAVFTHRQPQKDFGVANPDHAILQLAAQQNERKRIAQELHDTLLQGFTCIALKLDALTNGLPPALAKTREQLQTILEQTDEYLAEARRSIWKLRSATLETTKDLPRALAKASERALAGTGIQLHFSVRGPGRRMQSILEDHLLRICEEAVANAAKHARPTRIEVALEFNPEAVQLCVRDDGCGFDPARSEAVKDGHFGLLGIKERVDVLSGTLLIDSARGRGTALFVTVPAVRP
jgi:signal transduction histidine kinase